MKHSIKSLFFALLLGLRVLIPAIAEPGNELCKVDRYRIYDKTGFSFIWKSVQNGHQRTPIKIYVNSPSTVLGSFSNTNSSKLILMKGNSFWFFEQNSMSSAIRISPRQMLVGEAGAGDITRIVFNRLYRVEEFKKSNNTLEFYLLAIPGQGATYAKINLKTNQDFRPIIARCYTKQGVLLKTIIYSEYKNINGRELLTKFKIINAIDKQISIISLSNFRKEKLPDADFNKDFLPWLNL